MQNNSIAIVGCGIAGISASIELIKRNIPHTIFESRNIVGGRFYSFYDRHFEREIDNGQHLIFSENKNFLDLISFLTEKSRLKFNKVLKKFERKTILFFENGKIEKFILFSPFSLLSFRSLFFNLKQLARLVSFFKNFVFKNSELIPKNISTYDFLMQKRLGKKIISRFWEPFCVSIFNNSLEQIPAYLTIQVMKSLFYSANENDNRNFLYLKIPQSQLLAKFSDILTSNGSEIYFSKSIIKLSQEGNKFALYTQNDERFLFDKVILCVQPNVIKKILPEEWTDYYHYFKFLKHINFNPILSINILTKYKLTDEYWGYFLFSPIHWIFNKSNMYNIEGPPYFYSFTTSYAVDLVNLSTSDILDLLGEVVQSNFFIEKSQFLKNYLLKYKIIKEKFATIDLNLQFDKYRPEQKTPIEGLYIAGDWTQTNLPATLESAALSGKLAVEKLLERL